MSTGSAAASNDNKTSYDSIPAYMRAGRIHQHGGVDVIQIETKVAVPRPAAGQVLVRAAVAGVNYIDTYQRSGLYKVSFPFTLGREGVGEVVELGAGVSGVRVGDKVGYVLEGCYADYVLVPAERALPVPSGISLATACAALLQGMTVHYLITSTYVVKSGDVVLIHAGAGGCGQLLIQCCRRIGARVITTVSSSEKAAIAAQLGAHHVVNYKVSDFHEEVMRITERKGCNVVYDGVGKDTYAQSLKCLSPLGHLVLFGQSSGRVPPIDPLDLSNGGSLTLTRPNLKDYIATPAAQLARWRDLVSWIGDARSPLRFSVSATFPLEKAVAAHTLIESRQSTGKILLQINDIAPAGDKTATIG